jgi:hypothetical protein
MRIKYFKNLVPGFVLIALTASFGCEKFLDQKPTTEMYRQRIRPFLVYIAGLLVMPVMVSG